MPPMQPSVLLGMLHFELESTICHLVHTIGLIFCWVQSASAGRQVTDYGFQSRKQKTALIRNGWWTFAAHGRVATFPKTIVDREGALLGGRG